MINIISDLDLQTLDIYFTHYLLPWGPGHVYKFKKCGFHVLNGLLITFEQDRKTDSLCMLANDHVQLMKIANIKEIHVNFMVEWSF